MTNELLEQAKKINTEISVLQNELKQLQYTDVRLQNSNGYICSLDSKFKELIIKDKTKEIIKLQKEFKNLK